MLDEPLTVSLPVTTRGRYLAKVPAVAPRAIVVAFHGYGENAERQLDRLRGIPRTDELVLCAVQGLHWFYNLKTEQVVASWMTRLEREAAIADNIEYADRVVVDLKSRLDPQVHALPLFFAGFSQGAAMAYRASAYGRHRAAGLVILGGDLPPEIAADDSVRFPPILLARGISDPMFGQSTFERDAATLRTKSERLTLAQFQAGHDWTPEFAEHVGRFFSDFF